jgi:hypothetical protein
MSSTTTHRKVIVMTEEEAVLQEASSIVEDAQTKEEERYRNYVRSVALTVEETLHKENGQAEGYQLYTLRMAHKGTPESVKEFRKEVQGKEDNVVNVTVEDEEDGINSCIEMECAFAYNDQMPANLNELLNNKTLILAIHAMKDNLIGMVARTGAWASNGDKGANIAPSEDPDRKSMTITLYLAGSHIVIVPRDDQSGEVIMEAVKIEPVFYPSENAKEQTGHSNTYVTDACAEYLADSMGASAALFYRAYALPQALKFDDNEMYQAVMKDAASAIAKAETEQE